MMRGVLQPPPDEVAEVRDLSIPGPGGRLALRLYRGAGTSETDALPALLFLHGGGWVLGDLDSHDGMCRRLANLAACRVVAVDYRLAPEHRFPAAIDDASAALAWMAANAPALGIDPARLAVGGDSAGGNLAAVLAIRAGTGRRRQRPANYCSTRWWTSRWTPAPMRASPRACRSPRRRCVFRRPLRSQCRSKDGLARLAAAGGAAGGRSSGVRADGRARPAGR